jgi:hypothetical protein
MDFCPRIHKMSRRERRHVMIARRRRRALLERNLVGHFLFEETVCGRIFPQRAAVRPLISVDSLLSCSPVANAGSYIHISRFSCGLLSVKKLPVVLAFVCILFLLQGNFNHYNFDTNSFVWVPMLRSTLSSPLIHSISFKWNGSHHTQTACFSEKINETCMEQMNETCVGVEYRTFHRA